VRTIRKVVMGVLLLLSAAMAMAAPGVAQTLGGVKLRAEDGKAYDPTSLEYSTLVFARTTGSLATASAVQVERSRAFGLP
jgi:hypothetical protein